MVSSDWALWTTLQRVSMHVAGMSSMHLLEALLQLAALAVRHGNWHGSWRTKSRLRWRLLARQLTAHWMSKRFNSELCHDMCMNLGLWRFFPFTLLGRLPQCPGIECYKKPLMESLRVPSGNAASGASFPVQVQPGRLWWTMLKAMAFLAISLNLKPVYAYQHICNVSSACLFACICGHSACARRCQQTLGMRST